MNREDIFRMAQEAGFEGCAELSWESVICTEELEAFAALVASAEREACADLCTWRTGIQQVDAAVDTCAAAIRARSKE